MKYKNVRKVCSFAVDFCSDYAGYATTFPTNEYDWSSKVKKVRKIFVKPLGEGREEG